jgi:hypothetical protein
MDVKAQRSSNMLISSECHGNVAAHSLEIRHGSRGLTWFWNAASNLGKSRVGAGNLGDRPRTEEPIVSILLVC